MSDATVCRTAGNREPIDPLTLGIEIWAVPVNIAQEISEFYLYIHTNISGSTRPGQA